MLPLQYRKILAILLVSVATVCLILLSARQPKIEPEQIPLENDTPEACLKRLLTAEQQGDSRSYLACFSRKERQKFSTRWQGRSPSRIREELQTQVAGLAGQVTTDVIVTDASDAEVILERIWPDHIQRQTVSLVRESGIWRIAKQTAPEWKTPDIPYGTPVDAR